MSAETEEPIRAPAPENAPAAAAGGKGMSPMVFFGAMGLSWILMLGGGFALVQFVLPAKLAEAMKPAAAAEADGKSEGDDAKKEEKGHGEAKADSKDKEKDTKEKEKPKAEAKKEGESKKEEKGHGESAKKEEKGHGEGGGKEEASAEKAKPKEFVLSEIVVNVAGSRGARYIKASVFFDASPEVLDELEAQRARVIDLVSSALSSKTMDELTAPNARGTLREELTATCNGLLKKGQINNLYFVDFLIQ